MSVTVTRDPSLGFRFALQIRLDPKELGPERMAEFWTGIGCALKAILTEEEKAEFLRQLEEARKQSGAA